MALTLHKKFEKNLDHIRVGNRKVFNKASALVMCLYLNQPPLQDPRPESRIRNALKWDLGDGYRCFGIRSQGDILLLTVGKHDEVELFIDRHRGFYAPKGGKHLTELRKPEITEYIQDAESKESLKKINKEFFMYFGLNHGKADEFASRIATLEGIDSSDFMELLAQIPSHVAEILLQYATDYTKREAIEGLVAGTHEQVQGEKLVSLSKAIENSEEFITFDDPQDLEQVLEKPLEDWMLYLHPEQRRWARSSFSGPARLRGISGSGKTSVAIHRASHLARSFRHKRDRLLFVTYNPDLADVIGHALRKLCGLELRQIFIRTLGQWCSEFLRQQVGPFDFISSGEAHSRMFLPAYNKIRKKHSRERLWTQTDPQYLYEEIRYIKGRFMGKYTANYRSMERHGRGIALSDSDRKIVIELYEQYQINIGNKYDSEEITCACLREILERKPPDRPYYKAVIIDEVQDFSQIELKLLFAISGKGENQFFMVGDGAQKIYRTKGYSLALLGIDIAGRSTVLRKNYRNTRQIMEAAYELVKNDEEELSEDLRTVAILPEYSARRGPQPCILKFATFTDECDWVANEVKKMVENGHSLESCAVLSSGTDSYGEKLYNLLQQAGVPSVLYSEEQAFTDPKVKIGTFESVKGLEFRMVFIMGATTEYVPAEPREDVSKFYVAMTRARDQLYITYSLRSNDREFKPSLLLNRIEKFCDFKDLS